MYRLEHAWVVSVGIEICAGRNAERASQSRAEVRQNVRKQIRSDDYFQRLRFEDKAGCHRVDQPLFSLNLWIVGCDEREHFVPQRHAVLLRIRLRDTGHLVASPGQCQIERETDDPLAAFFSEQTGLNREAFAGSTRGEITAA